LAKSYRPYTTDRRLKNRRLKMVMLALIVVIVGLVVLIKSRKDEASPPPTVELNNVRPPSRTPTEPARERTSPPQPVAPAAELEPVQEPAPLPTPPVQEIEAVEAVEPVVPEPAPAPTPAEAIEQPADKTSTEAQELIENALKLRDAGNLIAARDLLNDALNMKLSEQVRTGVMMQLAKLAETWLFGREVLQGDTLTGYYLVQPGDLLSTIGRRHTVPYETLMQINDIARPELLRAGARIKVIHGPFNAVVNRTTFTLDLYLQNLYVKSYKVGLGRPEHTTPTGRWVVAPGGKLISPTWTDPDTGRTYRSSDSDYPLGSRWIALEGIEGDAKGRTGFALHGTKDPETIGMQSSRGCIRLHNGDVIEVYNLMEPGHSAIVVTD